jgi:hypothetical protein
MGETKGLEIVFYILMLTLFTSDFYKGILMVFTNQYPLLFIAKISSYLFIFLPQPFRDKRYKIVMDVYRKRSKIYGFCALIGCPYGICLSIISLCAAFLKT